MGLKSQEKQSEQSVTELSQELLVVLELPELLLLVEVELLVLELLELLVLDLLEMLLLELSVVDLTELLVVGVLVIEGSAEFGADGFSFPGRPEPSEGPSTGGTGGTGIGMGTGTAASPGVELESVGCVDEDELIVTEEAVMVDWSLGIVDTGIAVVFELPLGVSTVLMSVVAIVVSMLDKRLILEDVKLGEVGVARFDVAFTVTVDERLDNENVESEAVLDKGLVIFCNPDNIGGRLVIERAVPVDTAVEFADTFMFDVVVSVVGKLEREKVGNDLVLGVMVLVFRLTVDLDDGMLVIGFLVIEEINLGKPPVLISARTVPVSECKWLIGETPEIEGVKVAKVPFGDRVIIPEGR